MKYGVISVVLAMWLTFTNASPFQGVKDPGMKNIQKLVGELISSVEKEDNTENLAKRTEVSRPDDANAQDCDWWSCGFTVAGCAGSCFTLNAPGCVTCLGSSYNECIGCFSQLEQMKKQEEIMRSQNAITSLQNAVKEKLAKKTEASNLDDANAQECDWWDCGFTVAGCASDCYYFNAPDCANCLGTSYNKCIGCFSQLEQMKKQEEMIQSQNAVTSLQNAIKEKMMQSHNALISLQNAIKLMAYADAELNKN